jgi:hypothetical protein
LKIFIDRNNVLGETGNVDKNNSKETKMKLKETQRKTSKDISYRATVVDLVPGVSDEKRATECTSEAVAETIEEAERQAIDGSAVNCNRRVYVAEEFGSFRTVKGPYVLKATA